MFLAQGMCHKFILVPHLSPEHLPFFPAGVTVEQGFCRISTFLVPAQGEVDRRKDGRTGVGRAETRAVPAGARGYRVHDVTARGCGAGDHTFLLDQNDSAFVPQ